MLNFLRRVLGMHVHEWELTGSRVVEVEQAVRRDISAGVSMQASSDPELITVPLEILTFKCRGCGKVKESRGHVG